jgi:hypothetical protein
MENVATSWQEFKNVLRLYGNAASCLNLPCPSDKIAAVELALGMKLPLDLVEILKLNDGQTLERKGIFKSVSGWDLYRRHIFLDIDSIAIAYETFIQDNVLLQEFGDKEIPFAVSNQLSSYDEVFSINRDTQRVSLIWTQYIDPFNPPEWQVGKFVRGENLVEFLKQQSKFYW